MGDTQANAILLVTGSELTRGETRDRNGPFLGTELTELGVRVDEIRLVPDEPRLLAETLRDAIAHADLVTFTGGLGPTADDHTVKVCAEVTGRKIYRHPEAMARMKARVLARGLEESEIPENFWKQAETLEGAEVLLNPVGLAPGFALETARGLLVVMPGVPREMEAMFLQLAVPILERTLHLVPPRIVRAKILGLGESWAEARIQKLGVDFSRIEYGISAKPGELLVKFTAHKRGDHALLDGVRSALEREFGADLVLLPEGLRDEAGAQRDVELSALVHQMLLEKQTTLALAESCTGGLVAKALTDHPGSSSYFLGAVVAYDNRIKETLLGVSPELLREHGAVSEAVARAMAEGARARLGAAWAVSTTGVAGPDGGTAEKPVGLVHFAVAGPSGTHAESHRFSGNRDMVRTQAAAKALDLLRRQVAVPPSGGIGG